MSFTTAKIISLIGVVAWIIAILFPYDRFGISKRRSLVIKIAMAGVFLGTFALYAVSTR